MNANPFTLLLRPRGLPPGWSRANAREALWATRDAALVVLLRVHPGDIARDQVHGVARWELGLGLPHRFRTEDQAALLEAWAGRIAAAGLRLGRGVMARRDTAGGGDGPARRAG